MGVLMKSGSALKVKDTAEIGVAEVISDGKVAVTGVVSFPNLGLAPGMMMVVGEKKDVEKKTRRYLFVWWWCVGGERNSSCKA